jgi:hypothetical protein
MGIAILSTSQGIMTDREARLKRIGGSILCHLYLFGSRPSDTLDVDKILRFRSTHLTALHAGWGRSEHIKKMCLLGKKRIVQQGIK